MEWQLITPEYPPQSGGVSDYTMVVATGLAAAGDEVHVWCPGEQRSGTSGRRSEARDQRSEIGGQKSEGKEEKSEGVTVHREFGRFAPSDLRRVGRMLDQFESPRRLLVQWVPQGYGYRSINLPFCLWLWQRAKLKHDRVEIMVHEPFLAFAEGSRKQDMAAAVHRLMVVILLSAASHVWVSIPDWEKRLRPFLLGRKKSISWLPVPSNIPVIDDPDGIAKARASYAPSEVHLVGHFGAYDRYMMELMAELLPALIRGHGKLSVLLLGKGGSDLRDRLIERHPELKKFVMATGALSADDISRHISACDVMLQPYEDGVSGRRGSAMAALAHGVPVVTTGGKATENCWVESGAVKLTEVGDVAGLVEATISSLANEETKGALSNAAIELYRKRFDVRITTAALRESTVKDSFANSVVVSS